MHSARPQVLIDDLCVGEPRCAHDALELVLRDRLLEPLALRPIAVEDRVQTGKPRKRSGDRGDPERHALLGDQPAREYDEWLGGVSARVRSGVRVRRPTYCPRSTVTSPRSPSARRRLAWSSEKQNARCGKRAHSSCTA